MRQARLLRNSRAHPHRCRSAVVAGHAARRCKARAMFNEFRICAELAARIRAEGPMRASTLLLSSCIAGWLAVVGCAAPAAPPTSSAVVFEGARLIVDPTAVPIESSAFVIDDGRIIQVGERGRVTAPEGAGHIDLAGKTVIPALVDAHSHLGYTDVKRMTTAPANFTRENLIDHLQRYAYYGLAATLSMGVDRGELPFEIRANPVPGAALFRTAGRGISLPNAGPGADYRRDAPYGVSTETEARAAVRELAAKQVDVVKIW